jgi:hypothetical protein
MMFVMARVLNHTVLMYPSIVAFRVTTMVPPLLLSRILDLDLLILITKAALQKRSIVD